MLLRLKQSVDEIWAGLLCHCTKYIRNLDCVDVQEVVPRRR